MNGARRIFFALAAAGLRALAALPLAAGEQLSRAAKACDALALSSYQVGRRRDAD